MTDRHQKIAYPLRMPDDLRAKLETSAKDVGRSLNAEIVDRLQKSYDSRQSSYGEDQVVLTSNFDELMESFILRYSKKILPKDN